MMKRKIMGVFIRVWGIFVSVSMGFTLVYSLSIPLSSSAFAFSKLKNGFENLTTSYLVPLSAAVAGASFILYVILSYFRQEEYQRKVGNVLALTVFSATGLEIINSLIQSFS